MYYSKIKNCDIANGEGIRVTLFVSGCRNRCKNCFNPETWDFKYGNIWTQESEDEVVRLLKANHIKGLTILGGEPFEPENQIEILKLVERVKKELPQKDIWCFTGFTLDREIFGRSRASGILALQIIKYLDVLVDGRFVDELKNLKLNFRGSTNQRIIDVQNSIKQSSIVLSKWNNFV